ncbi:MAG: methyltransferase family protein [Acidobacteriota bacterium]
MSCRLNSNAMDATRYFLALLIVISFPAFLPIWFLIHPLARFWRRRGPFITYLVALTIAATVGAVLFQQRAALLREQFGASWPLMCLGVVLYVVSVFIEFKCRRHLGLATLVGLPEVSERIPNRLLTQGIYARVRHPRYVSVMIGTFAFAFFVNYLAVYLVAVATIPLLYFVVVLEERELLSRFGQQYEHYMRRVPRFIPRCDADDTV